MNNARPTIAITIIEIVASIIKTELLLSVVIVSSVNPNPANFSSRILKLSWVQTVALVPFGQIPVTLGSPLVL